MADDTLLAGIRGTPTEVTVAIYRSWKRLPDRGWSLKPAFIRQRLRERFIIPIAMADPSAKHGFTTMAVSCLLIETLEAFCQPVSPKRLGGFTAITRLQTYRTVQVAPRTTWDSTMKIRNDQIYSRGYGAPQLSRVNRKISEITHSSNAHVHAIFVEAALLAEKAIEAATELQRMPGMSDEAFAETPDFGAACGTTAELLPSIRLEETALSRRHWSHSACSTMLMTNKTQKHERGQLTTCPQFLPA